MLSEQTRSERGFVLFYTLTICSYCDILLGSQKSLSNMHH